MSVVTKDAFGRKLTAEESLAYSIEDIRFAFSHNVQRRLNQLKCNRKFLADKMGWTEQQLSDNVFGYEANPDLETIAKIAYYLDMKNILE